MDAEAIHAVRAQLGAFYLRAYHLKDALRDAAETGGIPTIKEIEDAITNDPDLALLADLCNQEKHPQMGKAPRSGEWPTLGRVAGSSLSSLPSDTWRLDVTFRHKGKDCDGLEAAERAVEAWRRWLTAEGLI